MATDTFGVPIVGPPGMPAEQTAILRKAFLAMAQDKDYQADARRVELPVGSPIEGGKLARHDARAGGGDHAGRDRRIPEARVGQISRAHAASRRAAGLSMSISALTDGKLLERVHRRDDLLDARTPAGGPWHRRGTCPRPPCATAGSRTIPSDGRCAPCARCRPPSRPRRPSARWFIDGSARTTT